MRTIKFRSWDKISKVMITSSVEWNIGMILKHQDDFELMQFTGLLDKNKKEIFEGDILKYGDKKDGIIIQIVWNDLSDNGFEILRQKDKNIIHDIRIYRFDEQAEIIGNIYENPELLEVKE